MGFAAVAFQVASAVISMASAVSQGYQQSRSQKNQAAALEYNARIAEQNASIARSEGILEETAAAEEAYRARGRLAAGQAQNGILGSATGEAVADDLKRQAEEEKFNIQFRSQLNQQGFLSDAANSRAQAGVYRSNAKQSVLGGWMNGVGSLAGGLSSAYGQGVQTGVFKKG